MSEKLVSAEAAVSVIQDGDTVCISGFVGVGTPDELLIALEKTVPGNGSSARFDSGLCRRRPGMAKTKG